MKKELLKQKTKEYKIEIKEINNIDLNLLNKWFLVLDLKIEEIFFSDIENICEYILILHRKISQVCLLPIFYKGRILKIENSKENISISLALSYIDLIPQDFYYKIIDFSFSHIFWMMKNEPNLQNINAFSDVCISKIINPIRKSLPPGKSRVPILQEAFNKDIPFIHLGYGIFQLGFGKKSLKLDRSGTQFDTSIGLNLSQNKVTTVNLLKMAGFPTSTQVVVKNKEELINSLNYLNYPLVIKPIDLDRGEGVTVNIFDEKKLLISFEEAYNLSKSKTVIVEKQIEGVCHRLFIANEKLLYCVKRLPISVQADGFNSIEKLIDKANEKENRKVFWQEKEFFPKDSLTLEALKKVNYSLDSIPKKDEWIELRDIESTKWGGRDENRTDCVHPDNLDIAIRATKLIGLNVAGVDIITTDISKSWLETNAIINEINYAPLLGGGEISKRYISTFLERFIYDNGRIPIEIFVGNTNESIIKAKEKHIEYKNLGFKVYFTSHELTFDENLNELKFSSKNLSSRILSLVLNSNVEALIIVIQNSEFLYNSFPIDKVSKINIVSSEILDIKTNKNLDEIEFKTLIEKIF